MDRFVLTLFSHTMALSVYPPTPYAIGVATLLAYIESDEDEIIGDIEEAEKFVEGLLSDRSLAPIEASLSDLLHHESLAELTQFDGWLQTATQTFDAFIDLMSSLTTANVKSTADIFRRALVLNYERLSMTEVVVLYKRFCRETKEAISNTKKPSTREISKSVVEFDSVLECLQNKDRVGAIEKLHKTMDHSLYALSAAGDFQELIFSTFGESTRAARREGIRATQKQGGHRQEVEADASTATNQEGPTRIDEDPELEMLQSLLNEASQSSLEDRHVIARKKLMGRFHAGQVLYQEALKCMIGNDPMVPFEFTGFFLHEWAIRRGDEVAAQAWMAAIECHMHPRLDASIFADYISQKALLLSRQGKWKQAVKLIEDYLDQQQVEEPSLGEAVQDRFCLQLGQILLDAKKYTAAQAVLLQCRVCAASLSLLAILHLEFYRDTEKARGFAEAACPTIMLKEHVFLQGQTMLTMARCTGSLQMYKKSLECFHAIQDVAALHKVYVNLANEYQKRNESAKHAEIMGRITELEQLPEAGTPLPDSDELLHYIDEYAALVHLRIRPYI